MATDPIFDSGRMLRRAANLTADHGRLAKDVEEPDPDSVADRRLRRQSTSSFGAAFIRKLQEVKSDATKLLSRSRSLSSSRRPVAPTSDLAGTGRQGAWKGKGPAQSQSQSQSVSEVCQPHPPGPVHSESAPAVMSVVTAQHKRPLGNAQEDFVDSPARESPLDAEAELREGVQTALKPGGTDVVVPQLLQLGTPMTKVSAKKHKKAVFRLDADLGQIVWESNQHKIIPIESIKEIRTGKDARYYREQFQLSQDYEERWLTIVYLLDGNYKTLHLIVATKDVFKMWETTLRQLHAIRQELMTGLGNLEMRQTLWEKQYWKGADEERDQKLSFEEVEKLCKRLNINSGQDELHRLFKQADTQNRGYLDFEDFRGFVKLLKGRPEIHRLYNKLKRQGVFEFAVFESFMRQKQQSRLTQEELLVLFQKYTTDSSSIMSLEGFTSFLLSPDNAVFSDQHAKVHHDMTRPLSEYFISSSHNTYLVGHQLVGDSTIEGYIRALLHSCRSVEVDIYDGDVEPKIFHGKTFTSKVSLREVCAAIKKYGFVASPYPIIISAEVHCSLPQQDMIAQIMIEVFGDSLIRHTGEDVTSDLEALPSPDDLKGKIMLKTKNLLLLGATKRSGGDSTTDSDGSSSFTDASASSASASEGEFGESIGDVPIEKKGAKRRSVGATVLQRVISIGKSPKPASPLGRVQSRPTTTDTSSVPVLSPRRFSETADRPTLPFSATSLSLIPPTPSTAKPKMSLALVALLVYTVGVKCRGLNKKEVYAPHHMFSLSESTALKMMKSGYGSSSSGVNGHTNATKGMMVDLIKHTKGHLVRIYPRGTRVSSSNYEPHRFWAIGAQLVALNWQTFDLGYMINHAMFQRNGRSGYVLKPLALRTPSPAMKDLLSKRTQHVFHATIISAQQLPRPKNALGHEIMGRNGVDPYVEVSLYVPDWPVVNSGGLERAPSAAGHLKRNKSKGSAVSSVGDANGSAPHPPDSDHPQEERGFERTPTAPFLLPPPIAHSHSSSSSTPSSSSSAPTAAIPTALGSSIPGKTISFKTSAVKNNGFNPVWEERLSLPFECVGDMMDLVFVRFVVRRQEDKEGDEPLAVYCASLGSLGRGYRHLPLHDSQLSQFLFSTLFVRIQISDVVPGKMSPSSSASS